MKDYKSLKSSINTLLESADAISDIKAVLKDQEDTRRSLLKVKPDNLQADFEIPVNRVTNFYYPWQT